MRIPAALFIAIALVGCDKGERPPAPPPPSPPAPTATIHGRATVWVTGGAAQASGHSSVSTSPIHCRVTVSSAWGVAGEAKTDATGAYELHVPPGHYQVSFAACGGEECANNGKREVAVDVGSGTNVDASWDCQAYAP